MSASPADKRSVYQRITDKIVSMVEEGGGTFKAPWHLPAGMAAHPTNAATHAEYRGVNVLGLWVDAMLRNFSSNLWASYRQWQSLGAQVRKGERGSLIVFYKRIETTNAEREDHDTQTGLKFVARASYVFNAAQVDGYVPEEAPQSQFDRCEEIEGFVQAVGARIDHGFHLARYRIGEDRIEMPDRSWFIPSTGQTAPQNYYAVLLHELVHWTGASHRLNRQFGKRFGDEAYAFEELVAELGAAFLCAAFGISSEPRPDHAAYVSHWLQALKSNPKAIFTAASRAQEAFDHLAYLATKND